MITKKLQQRLDSLVNKTIPYETLNNILDLEELDENDYMEIETFITNNNIKILNPELDIKALSAESSYMREVFTIPLFTPEEELETAKLVANGDENAKKSMIEHNLRLVISIARHYNNAKLEFMDLVSEGNLGLIKAVEKYDYTKGFRFSTYATYWIKQAITRAIDEKGNTITRPVNVSTKLKQLKRIINEYNEQYHTNPSDEYLSEKANISVDNVKLILRTDYNPIYFSTMINDDDDSTDLEDLIGAEDENINKSLYNEFIYKVLEDFFNNIMKAPNKELYKNIILMRFGLEPYEKPYTLDEIANQFNLSRERVRQIEAKILRQIRCSPTARRLRDFIRVDNFYS